MLERILLIVEDTPGLPAAAAWTLQLARALSARVFAVCVIPERTGGRSRTSTNVEERAWSLLYEVEDDAFAMNVKVSLLLEQGDPLRRLCEICTSYKTGLLVAGVGSQVPLADLVRHSPEPVVFVNSPKED
ncbi:universal stress protein [candidate division WOR-3 bacterium]|nr:universal stress protein [candidate division WOR-3 bacterium]